MTHKTGQVRIGISGWRYPPWRGVFYPLKWPQRRELEFASHMLPTIEINGSFYALQRPSSYESWYAQTPNDFVFSVKATRYITHLLRLKEVRTPLANFFASGVLALREKLGPFLWQFPPSMTFDAERFEAFFNLLPHDTDAALALAETHDAHMQERSWLMGGTQRAIRHAVEIRHHSFAVPAFVEMLRRHRIALVVADTAGRWPLLEDLTADFVYMRLHGDEELYASGYTDAALKAWSSRIDCWRHGLQVDDARLASDQASKHLSHRDVFCYFDNDVKVHAPYDAMRLADQLGLPTGMTSNRRFRPPGLSEKSQAAQLAFEDQEPGR